MQLTTRATLIVPEGLDELFEQWARTTGLHITVVGSSHGTSEFRIDADRSAQAILKAFTAYVTEMIRGVVISDRSGQPFF